MPTTSTKPVYNAFEQLARVRKPVAQSSTRTNRENQFENADIPPVVAAKPVGIYLDAYYNGMEGIAPAAPATAGIRQQSPLNEIGYGNTSLPTVLQGQPSITSVYPDSTVDFLDLISFYFGCVIGLRNSQAAPPPNCAVSHSRFLDVVRGSGTPDIKF